MVVLLECVAEGGKKGGAGGHFVKHTVFTQTHIPSSCWGLLREVRIDIPVPPQKRGLVLIDAPGAGDSDPARDRHLVAALRNAAAVICLGDSREVTGDIVRSLHKSGFLQQLVNWLRNEVVF